MERAQLHRHERAALQTRCSGINPRKMTVNTDQLIISPERAAAVLRRHYVEISRREITAIELDTNGVITISYMTPSDERMRMFVGEALGALVREQP